MANPSEEEHRFTVLLEDLEHRYKFLYDKMTGVEQKVDRELLAMRGDTETALSDVRTGIKGLVRDLKKHVHET